MQYFPALARLLGLAGLISMAPLEGGESSRAPRIDFIVPLERSRQLELLGEESIIWYDDFDDDALQTRYPEKSGETTSEIRLGSDGKSLRMHYAKGGRGKGGRKVFFGDTPTYGRGAPRRGEKFVDVYWRIYVRHQAGWKGGGPAKLSRATSIVPPGWRQAMIAHVWSSGESLTLDPASGVRDGRVITERYNDFSNLRWLGNKPVSRFRIHSTGESGWWICVEARARLNTPGKKDGVNQLWIDGRLEAERRNLDWRGTFDEYGINAVFLEAYWNRGSPVDQSRWIDHFVIATEPVGPVHCSRQPVLVRAADSAAEKQAWEVEVARISNASKIGASENPEVVWRSRKIDSGLEIRVEASTGKFVGPLRGQAELEGGKTYRVRVRQRERGGRWSPWSPWHQTFRAEPGGA